MTKMIYISLPVTDLPRSTAFYEALGFTRNPQFLGETAVGMVWSEAIQIMLLTYDEWKNFTTRPIPPSTSSEVGLKINFDSREAVDAAHDAAVAIGGVGDINPVEDYGFMYCRDFTDPDGHVWGAMWMDPAAMAQSE
ncbi:MAG: VOC family protein [Sphingopyxis sp.]